MTPTQINVYLRAIATGSMQSEAARAAGLSEQAFAALRKKDADFASAFEDAMEERNDILEREATRRALEGVEEPVVYQGQLTPVFERNEKGHPRLDDEGNPVQARNPDGSLKYLTIRKPSDALLALLLKGRRKKVFAERTELTGADGGPVQMTPTERASRIAALLDTLKRRKDLEYLA